MSLSGDKICLFATFLFPDIVVTHLFLRRWNILMKHELFAFQPMYSQMVLQIAKQQHWDILGYVLLVRDQKQTVKSVPASVTWRLAAVTLSS